MPPCGHLRHIFKGHVRPGARRSSSRGLAGDWILAFQPVLQHLLVAAPAIQATRVSLISSIRGDLTSDVRPSRFRNVLVIAQITVCTLLLVACGSLVRTTMAMTAFDIGFCPDHVIAMEIIEDGNRRVIDALSSDSSVDKIVCSFFRTVRRTSTHPDCIFRMRHPLFSPTMRSRPDFEVPRIPLQRSRNFTAQDDSR